MIKTKKLFHLCSLLLVLTILYSSLFLTSLSDTSLNIINNIKDGIEKF